jgi:hypothetical protein
MATDPFASGLVSTVLAWSFTLPILLSSVALIVQLFFGDTNSRLPRWFLGWLAFCFVFFSPFLYIVLQFIVLASYSVQSSSALWSFFSLRSFLFTMVYLPLVVGLLSYSGLLAPYWLTFRIAFHNLETPVVTTGRLILGTVIAPITMQGGQLLFYWLLTYVLIYTPFKKDRVRAEDMIGATNGPALLAYKYVIRNVIPLPIANHYRDVSLSEQDWLRNHVASFYLGPREEAKYLKLAYPVLYERLAREGSIEE